MFNKNETDKWFGQFEKAFSNLDKSIDKAGDNLEAHLKKRTDSTTPTDTKALLNSRKMYQELDENSLVLRIVYNESGSLDYAITEHNDIYRHDYDHNSSEVRALSGQPLLYLHRPLVMEREDWWKRVFSKVGWK